MVVHVRLAEPFWRSVGQRDLDVEVGPGSRVADVLAALGARYPALAAEMSGAPAQVFVGDAEAGDETQLEAGARVHLLWPVAGG